MAIDTPTPAQQLEEVLADYDSYPNDIRAHRCAGFLDDNAPTLRRALAALEAVEGWQVRVICVAVKDWDDAHRVEMQRINQTFRVGPDYWDTREEAEAYAEQLRVALGNPADAVEVSRGE